MSFADQRLLQIELNIDASQPALLAGLETWLHLGLLSERQVKDLGRQSLTCLLPELATEGLGVAQRSPVSAASSQNLNIDSPVVQLESGTPPTSAQASGRDRTTSRRRPTVQGLSLLGQLVQPLMAELSVVWLLFLGVFLVVVSSAILAASLWQEFSAQGQYLILLTYTLAFWLAGVWAGSRSSLRATAYMVQLATLLIIPVNFWVIDGFGLWRSATGLLIALPAALALTAATFFLLKPTSSSFQVGRSQANSRLLLLNVIALSWLHWGWGWAEFALVATYLGSVGTALALFWQDRNFQGQTAQPTDPQESAQLRSQARLPLGVIAAAGATLLLIARALLVAQVPIQQLGLAFGICGWLAYWLARREPQQEPATWAGAVLLLVGWSVSVAATFSGQALAVSGLGLWLLLERLRRYWRSLELIAIVLVGLQAFWLLGRLLPVPVREVWLNFWTQLAGPAFMPWALAGVVLFPYLLLVLLLATRLRRWQQSELAAQAELVALTLGFGLTLLSLANPLLRSLNLLLSGLTLAVMVRRRASASIGLIYLTHLTLGAALFSSVAWQQPNLGVRSWTGLVLLGVVGEWLFSAGLDRPVWRRSAWHIGLGLAALSYVLLLVEPNSNWRLSWLVVPITLTVIAQRRSFPQPALASGLSVVALLVLQPLTLTLASSRLVSLATAVGLMLLNTRQLRQLAMASITVGFALALAASVVEQVLPEALMTIGFWSNLAAFALLPLWFLRQTLARRTTTLAHIYAQSTDDWGMALAVVNLLVLALHSLSFALGFAPLSGMQWSWITAAIWLSLGTIYRNWQQPSNLGFYGTAWALEVLVAGLATQTDSVVTHWTIANLGLALLTQVAGDWRLRQTDQERYTSWNLIPVTYAILGLVGAHSSFTALTGLYTFTATLIGLAVSRRQASFKPWAYLSLFGITIAAYELLIYQLIQARTGSWGDGLLMLAILATAFALVENLLAPTLATYLRLSQQGLGRLAHLHWLGGSGLILLALLDTNSGSRWLSVGVVTLLALYAIFQGRRRDGWVYAGIGEAVIAVAHSLDLLLPDSQLLVAWGAALTCPLALMLYYLPWQAWGWSLRPWRRSAYAFPAIVVWLTAWGINLQSLLIVAAFYAWCARTSAQIRLSYFSVFLADWALVRLFQLQGWQEPLWYAAIVGGSLLYIAQIEPQLQPQSERDKRHILRSLATGLICVVAFYQSQADFGLGLLALGLSLGFILAGLTLRIRAFLYVGTVAFVLKVLHQLWLFVQSEAFLLWAMGILLGLALIWLAANFEARRTQMTLLLRNWLAELEAWQ
ncbi:hypothetical protein [Leptolyngbya sp. FACHB-261]|uniref:hypothetical protein n=1 Tax=Leptolyngbya sp. FACHB-261 TaxID=2692806 RepID=UPI001682419D|nr:hypothetical protein [Leptolyngbya sp. FACHB-261]MBD2100230.1 hypothetical protein [Leptolyngbya sp. FACHB-261]